MISLDSTLKSLEVKLAGAVATTELPFVASYVDINQSSFAISASSENDGTTNGATAATMAAAPGATTTRKLNYLSIVNVDTAAATVTVQVNNNATKRISFKVTLQVSDQLSFTDANGFVVFDANGNVKQSFNGIIPAANFPALSGDVTTTAGSLVTTIGAGKVTNTMLAGSIAASKLIGTDIATVGTITVGVWNAGAVTSSGTIAGVAGNFSGLLTVSGFGTHYYDASGAGSNLVVIRNQGSGNGDFAGLRLGTNSGENSGNLLSFSSAYATSTYAVADGIALEMQRAGGISIAASNGSGAIRFYSGGTTLRASFDASGDFQPGSDNSRSLGSTALRWSELYINPAASGVGDTFICLKSDGQIRSGATCAASTRKIKYAIRDFDDDLIDRLRPTTYRYRKGFYDQREDIGFLVEDLKRADKRLAFYASKGETLSNGLSVRKGDPITMNTNAVLAVAIHAIQTQKAAIQVLSQRVSHLKHD